MVGGNRVAWGSPLPSTGCYQTFPLSNKEESCMSWTWTHIKGLIVDGEIKSTRVNCTSLFWFSFQIEKDPDNTEVKGHLDEIRPMKEDIETAHYYYDRGDYESAISILSKLVEVNGFRMCTPWCKVLAYPLCPNLGMSSLGVKGKEIRKLLYSLHCICTYESQCHKQLSTILVPKL